MCTSLTQEVQLICNCCGQPYYPNKSWEDRTRAIIFGAEMYSVCPLCTQEVPSDVFADEGYRERCLSEVARLQQMYDLAMKNLNQVFPEQAAMSKVNVAAKKGVSRMKPQQVRVVIADDHPIFREGLRRFLETEPDLKVIGEASDGAEAVTLVRQLKPDILLLDLAMPISGLEALRELSTPANATAVRVILHAAYIEKSHIVEALQLGARGVVLICSATQVFLKAIRTVMAGEYWVLREPVSNLEQFFTLMRSMHEEVQQKTFGLTPRELEIVSAVVMGYANIAECFTITEDTVKHHLSNIFDKLGVSSRLELALFAATKGIPLKSIEELSAHSPHKPTAQ